MKRKYVKKEKIIDIQPPDKNTFDKLLKISTTIKPPNVKNELKER